MYLVGGFGLCFRVLGFRLLFVGCFGEFCICVLPLWGFWISEGISAITPFLFSLRKGGRLGQVSRMLGPPCSEIPDLRAAALYSERYGPTQNNCAFPRGRQCPGQNSQRTPPPCRVPRPSRHPVAHPVCCGSISP